MNSTVRQLGILLFMLLISLNGTYSQQVMSFESLLQEMADRENLTQYPSPFYTCRQFSSYDRASVDSNLKGWFANWGRNMFIRTEVNHDRNEYVLMDAEGSGMRTYY